MRLQRTTANQVSIFEPGDPLLGSRQPSVISGSQESVRLSVNQERQDPSRNPRPSESPGRESRPDPNTILATNWFWPSPGRPS